MANFRSKQLWETRRAVMQVVVAAILVMTITGGVVRWGVAQAGDLKDAVEGLASVTTQFGSFNSNVETRFGAVDARLGNLEKNVEFIVCLLESNEPKKCKRVK